MSHEFELTYKTYLIKKQLCESAKSFILDNMEYIRDLITRTNQAQLSYGVSHIEYVDEASVNDGTLTISSTNFKFQIIDNEIEFKIKYEIIEPYTRKHMVKLNGIEAEGELFEIFKLGFIEPHTFTFIKVENYFIFEALVIRLESLEYALSDEYKANV